MSNPILVSRWSHVVWPVVKYIKDFPHHYSYWWNHTTMGEKIFTIVWLGCPFWGLGLIGAGILRREIFAQPIKGMTLMTIPTAIFLIVIVREFGKSDEISDFRKQQRPFTAEKARRILNEQMSYEEHRAKHLFYSTLLAPLKGGWYYGYDQQPHPNLQTILIEFEEKAEWATDYNALYQELKERVKWPQEAKPSED